MSESVQELINRWKSDIGLDVDDRYIITGRELLFLIEYDDFLHHYHVDRDWLCSVLLSDKGESHE